MTLDKFWVSKGQGEYVILKDVFDGIAGNIYETVESGFETAEDAQIVANLMNTDLQLYLDQEFALCHHDPAEVMEELGYVFENGKWKRTQ